MESDRFIFDIGARFEQINGDIRRERTATIITDPPANRAGVARRDLGQRRLPDGQGRHQRVGGRAGALYKLTDDLNIYANASRGYFFPEIRAVGSTPSARPQSYTARSSSRPRWA